MIEGILSNLLHPQIEVSVQLSLIVLSFFASAVTASLGIGGGTLMLAAMASALPAMAIVPVHGAVQLGSNFGRLALLRNYIDPKLLASFTVGGLIGAAIGGQLVVTLPTQVIQAVLGIFILYSAWGGKLRLHKMSDATLVLGGLLTTLVTMFVSATGPLVLSLMKLFTHMNRVELVANNAACMSVQHALKVIVFAILGFQFSAFVPFIAVMIIFGLVGTWAGKKILFRIDETLFLWALNSVLTVLALRLLWLAWSA